jgi:hypothetical protein
MFKYIYQDNTKDWRFSISEWMVDEEKGVELRFDGLAPEETVYFRYADGDLTFRIATYRDTSQGLSETVVVSLGFGLKRAEPASKRAIISAERIRMISRNIDEALRAWPASSRALGYPPPYSGKQIPIRRVEFQMAGWEGVAP